METVTLSLLIIGSISSVNGLQFEPLTYNTGIIYTNMSTVYTYYTKWHLCYYYDLELYYEQINKLEVCVKQLRDICGIMLDKNICNITTALFSSDFGHSGK